MGVHPVRFAQIDVPLIHAGLRVPTPHRDELPPDSFAMTADNMFLHDPERPFKDPNELLRERGGKMLDRNSVNHNCPCCEKTMSWPLFAAHARECFERAFHTLPTGLRVYRGVSLDAAGAED